MIKLYPGGRFSGLLADGAIKAGDELRSPAPTASSRCAPARRGGCCSSAAAPAWRRSCRCCARWPRRAPSARRRTTTAPAPRPTSSTSRSSSAPAELPDFVVPRSRRTQRLGRARPGLITDVVDRLEDDLAEVDAYLCGPPPMVDAAIALLEARGVPESHIYFDKFTTTADE